jgi:hypothetical protein
MSLDLAPLLGTWKNFKPGGSGITRVDVREADAGVDVRVHGSGDGDAPDWGVAPARVFTDGASGSQAWAFRADYDLGFQRVGLYGYLNRGLLAIDIATSFAGDDPRRGYYSRTFFCRP